MNFRIDFLTMFLQKLLNNRPATCLTILIEEHQIMCIVALDTSVVSLSPMDILASPFRGSFSS